MTRRILYVGLDYPQHLEGSITHCPLIQIVPRSYQDEAISHSLSLFLAYTHVLITSKSAIPILMQYLPLFGYSQQDWQSKKILAIGQATAKELAKNGITPFLIAKEETSEGLIAELKAFSPSSFFFWPHSSLSRPVIREFFQAQAFRYQECSLYDTKPRRPDSLPPLEAFDEIIFTSPSTIDAFMHFYGSLPENKSLRAIGPITEHHLRYVISSSKRHHSTLA